MSTHTCVILCVCVCVCVVTRGGAGALLRRPIDRHAYEQIQHSYMRVCVYVYIFECVLHILMYIWRGPFIYMRVR